MALESATYIQDLVSINPTGSDQKQQGDDHLRLIKAVLKTTFPDATAAIRTLGWNAKTPAVNAQTGGYSLVTGDNGKLISFTLSADQTLTLPGAGSVGFGNGFLVWVLKDSGLNVLTIASGVGETINGQANVALGSFDGGFLESDGAAWRFVGTSRSLWRDQRLIRRSVNDANLYPGLVLQRTKSGTAAANDYGTSIEAQQQDGSGNLDVMGRIAWRLLTATNGSEHLAWFIENVVAGAISSADRLWKGQGLYFDGLTDQGAKTINALKLYLNNDQIGPLGDLSQLTAPNIDSLLDRILIRDTSAADHMWAAAKDVGGWSVLTEQTAAASATLDFVLTTFLTNFEDFQFIISGLVPGTDAQALWIRTSTDGGATYDSGAGTYGYGNLGETTGALQSNNSNSDTHMEVGTTTLGSTAGEVLAADVTLHNPADATKRTQFTWKGFHFSATPNATCFHGGGARLAAADVDAVRFMMASGTLASGKITLLGRRKAA